MARRRQPHFHRPFAGLKARLDAAGTPAPPEASPDGPPPADTQPMTEREEQRVFHDAMADVSPARWQRMAPYHTTARQPGGGTGGSDASARQQLRRLVEDGEGFTVNQTAEYTEVRQHWVPPNLPRRLHRGDFSIQAHIDLHGFGVNAAKDAVDAFLGRSIRDGLRAVLIVHGRGLSSPGKPILKNRVYRWLTHGQWRKWVMAFSSAPRHDGGTGATYVLLNAHPIPKKLRKFTSATDR